MYPIKNGKNCANLLDEEDPEIVLTVVHIALAAASEPEPWRAVRRIIEILPSANWFLRTETRVALAESFELAKEQVEDEIARRIKSGDGSEERDVVFRLLVKLRTQVMEMRKAHR